MEVVSRWLEYAVRDSEMYKAGLGGLCELLFSSLTGCGIWKESVSKLWRL